MIYDLKGRLITTLESGTGMAGTYVSGAWNCEDDDGNRLVNGTYIYVVEATDGNDQVAHAKGKLSLVN